MTDLTPNHPAVEAASMAPYEGREWAADLERMHGGQSFREAGKPGLAAALTAALPHLTADDLRHTPAGRALMAEGWDALIESMSASGEFHDVDLRTMERLNPYRGGNA